MTVVSGSLTARMAGTGAGGTTVNCLTLTQPFGTLIACGEKRIETRSWKASQGAIGQLLAIHAAKNFPREAAEYALDHPEIRAALVRHGYHTLGALPFGAVVATCRLVDCVPTTAIERTAAVDWISDAELAFGDLSDGRFAWLLADVVALSEPIPARGALGLWEWEWDEALIGVTS